MASQQQNKKENIKQIAIKFKKAAAGLICNTFAYLSRQLNKSGFVFRCCMPYARLLSRID